MSTNIYFVKKYSEDVMVQTIGPFPSYMQAIQQATEWQNCIANQGRNFPYSFIADIMQFSEYPTFGPHYDQRR